MKGLLRPLCVGGLSIAIAGTTLLGSSSVAFAFTAPSFNSLAITTPVNEGDKPTVTGTFTDLDLADQHTVQINWGDASMDLYTLPVGDRSFSLQKSIGFPDNYASLMAQVSLSDGRFTVSRFLNLTVLNVTPSITSFGLSATVLDAGQTATATGGFDDPGTADTHTVTVDWGDGLPVTTLSLARRVYVFTTPAHMFARAGTFTVTATVTDKDGAFTTATSSITVNGLNQAPTVSTFGVTPGNEGGSSSLALAFADADPTDTHTVLVAWGDGLTTDSGTLASDVTTYSTTHLYADTGTYPVVLTLKDSAGNTVTAGASVSPANVAPAVGTLTLSPASLVDHQMLTVGGDFTDPGTADTFTLTLDWGDKTSSTASLVGGARSFSATHSYDAAGPVTVKATVTDRDNAAGSSSASLVVLPSNHAPADLTLAASAVAEGGATTLSVSFTDTEALDTHTVAINWGDGSTESVALTAGLTTTSPKHTYAETGSYSLAVTVTDGGGLSVSGGTTVNAVNVAPSVAALALSPSPVTDRQTLTLSGSFSDPGTADTFTVLVDWGDHTAASTQSLAAGVRSFTASHDYASGTWVATATVTDRDGGAGVQTASVVVSKSNTSPSALSLTPTVNGSTVVVGGSFTDPDPLDTHTVTMSWGDATTTMNLAPGVTSFTVSHAYGTGGTYTLDGTVTDPVGASASASVQAIVALVSSSVSELLDEMSALVRSFELDRNTERWLLRRIDDLKASLSSGNAQVCADLRTLAKVSTYSNRVLSADQFAALNALASKLGVAAGCSTVSPSQPSPKNPVVKSPATNKPLAPATPDKNKSEKSEKSDKGEKSDKQGKTERNQTHRFEGRE